MRNELFSIFDQLCLMTPVSSGDGNGVIFLTFDSSFMWCEQFCPGRTFYFEDFYLIGKSPQCCQYPLAIYLNMFNIVAGISTTNQYRVEFQIQRD